MFRFNIKSTKLIRIMLILLYWPVVINFLFNLTSIAQTSSASPEKIKGKVINVVEDKNSGTQTIEVILSTNQVVEVHNNPNESPIVRYFKSGDRVILLKFMMGEENQARYTITDYQRTDAIVFVFLIFVILAVVIGKKHGFYSLIGMFYSFLIIFNLILPQIISGKDPILITVIAALMIVPVTFYLSHGFNYKTHTAIASTAIALIITTLLTGYVVKIAHLTGFASEEAMFLQIAHDSINMKGILLAGIIIGFLGVLDDVTVSQASIVSQLRKTKKNYSMGELYKDAMEVGRDHITSMINTLVLVYTGASLPLLLLFVQNPQPFWDVLNMEILADEIIRTLVGSIGLVIAVPISTFISALVAESIDS